MDFDDFDIAAALKSDAANAASKYRSLGLSAYLPKRPTGAAPKPNTRFLRNIIKETDSHNAALLAKERRDADERAARSQRHSRLHHDHDEHHRKRRKVDSEDYSRDHEKDERRVRDSEEQKSTRKHRDRRRSISPYRLDKRRRERDGVRHRRRRSSTSSEERTGSKSHSRRERSPQHHSSRRREEKRRSERDRTPADEPKRRRSRSPSPPVRSKHSTTSERHVREPSASDSDPLEAIVGPPPPPPEPKVKSRGRGAKSSAAAMDQHFSIHYDPKLDAQPNSDTDDDWDQALEALKDRQRWQQQGADRLRAAGFSDQEVAKWAKGPEKDEADVRWAKRGEDREWDRGKVVSDDNIELAADWGRLKGT